MSSKKAKTRQYRITVERIHIVRCSSALGAYHIERIRDKLFGPGDRVRVEPADTRNPDPHDVVGTVVVE